MTNEKTCFLISPIGPDGSEIRIRANKVQKYIVTPPLNDLGYKVVRADAIDESGLITNQIIECLIDHDMVVADISGGNPNVFYELAIRHVLRKPVVQIMGKEEKVPFDVASVSTIIFDIQDLDSVESAKESIFKQIKTFEDKAKPVSNPFTVATQFKTISESGDPEEEKIADLLKNVLEPISSIQDKLQDIQTSFRDPEKLLPVSHLSYALRQASPLPRSIPLMAKEVRELSEKIMSAQDSKEGEQNESLARLSDLVQRLEYSINQYS